MQIPKIFLAPAARYDIHLHGRNIFHAGKAYPVHHFRLVQERVGIHKVHLDVILIRIAHIVSPAETDYRGHRGTVVIRELRLKILLENPKIEAPVFGIGEHINVVGEPVSEPKRQIGSSHEPERGENRLGHQRFEHTAQERGYGLIVKRHTRWSAGLLPGGKVYSIGVGRLVLIQFG